MSKYIKCPKCGSHAVQAMGNDRKGFSVGKALVGSAFGGVGALIGFAGKKGKYDLFCMNCGREFQHK